MPCRAGAEAGPGEGTVKTPEQHALSRWSMYLMVQLPHYFGTTATIYKGSAVLAVSRGFQVSSGTASWYRSSYGSVFEIPYAIYYVL